MKVDPDPNTWQFAVGQYIRESIPWLLPYVRSVVFREVDAARGAGFGYIVLTNRKAKAVAPVIVRNFELLPIDVFESDEMHPLTQRRLYESLGLLSMGRMVAPASVPPSKDISPQTMPPIDATVPKPQMAVFASEVFDAEPRWVGPKMTSGPPWAFERYDRYLRAGVDPDDAKSRIADEFFERSTA